MTTSTYILWGVVLWATLIMTQEAHPDTGPGGIDPSWGATVIVTAFATFMVMSWPLTIPIALLRQHRRP